MAEHILVTGGAGFIGSFIVDALLERGHRVRILDSLEPQVHGDKLPEYLNPEAELIRGSVLDPGTVGRALDGVDVVYHEAAIVGVGQSMYDIRRYCEGNTMGAAVVLEAVLERRDRIRKMIVASSMSIYGEGAYRTREGEVRAPRLRKREALERGEWEPVDERGAPLTAMPTPETKPLHPTSVYAVTKRDHEELFLSVGYAYRIPTVALRYFNVYGPRQALSNPYTGVGAIFSSRLLNGKPPVIYEDGAQTRDFVHVSDIVQANLLALESDAADYEAVNVGTGRPTSIHQLAEMIRDRLGVDAEPEITGSFREGDIRHCYADIARARDLLGYEPRVRIEDGVEELVGWVRSQEAEDRFETARQELSRLGLA